MGLPRSAIGLLLHEAARVPFRGKIATLGRQHVYARQSDVLRMADRHRVRLFSPVEPLTLHQDPELARKHYLSDDSLFQLLGFEHSTRIDYSDYEAADQQLDLNQACTPPQLVGQFDVVLDSGTIEHVFDIAAALRHCARLVRPGGRIIHLTPSSNSVDHGFYSVSPTTFRDFYAASGFHINRLYLCQMPRRFERRSWRVFDYQAGGTNWLPLGRLTGDIWFSFLVATAGDAVLPATPQQSLYEQTWSQASQVPLQHGEPTGTKAARLLNAAGERPWLAAAAKQSIRSWRAVVNRWRDLRRGRVPYPYVGRF